MSPDPQLSTQFFAALCKSNMSNLRSLNLRARDIKKLAMHKLQDIAWDTGCDESSEWVFVSIDSAAHKDRLLEWLGSKGIQLSSEVVIVTTPDAEVQRLSWGDILFAPEQYFSGREFKMYDVGLVWVLEYAPQEIARFGRV